MTTTDDAEPTEPAVAAARVGQLASISIDCADTQRLADFYAALLGMRRVFEAPDGHVIALSDGGICVTMIRAENHVAPTWPAPDRPQQMHLDLAVTDLDSAFARAIALGAREADHQPNPEVWRVLLDPAGHPFCLTTATPD